MGIRHFIQRVFRIDAPPPPLPIDDIGTTPGEQRLARELLVSKQSRQTLVDAVRNDTEVDIARLIERLRVNALEESMIHRPHHPRPHREGQC